jgi:UDP-N-acetylmuramoyl-L-alanyl-D-glutamate--2,6-diaminopimelate ligase
VSSADFIKLSALQILSNLEGLIVSSAFNPVQEFSNLSCSTSTITSDCIFVAVIGAKTDGHLFIDEALKLGATGFVVSDKQKFDQLSAQNINVILVTDTRKALSKLAYCFTDKAADKLSIIGVTGTNGKTTTHWMIDSLLKLSGKRTARLGTIGAQIDNQIIDSSLTTPDPIWLHSFFAQCVKNNIQYVTMEVSSHALDQARVEDIRFSVAAFTNLSRDHLDYHNDMTSYAKAKCHLFDLVKSNSNGQKIAVINLDNEWSNFFVEYAANCGCEVNGYSKTKDAKIRCVNLKSTPQGSQFDLVFDSNTYKINSDFIGEYNIENLLTAIGVVVNLGIDPKKVASLVENIPQVPGRLERCSKNSPIGVFVDYSHTPDALLSALKALRPICDGKLWVIFGCGGDRDKGKRPLMLNAAKEIADLIMVTSDNPRTEDPKQIIDDILSVDNKSAVNETTNILVEVDRKKAILQVLSKAKPTDVVLVAGKGHEDYQIIGTQKIFFSDQKIVEEYFSK